MSDQTLKVLQLMEAEGIEPNVVMLNVLINAFSIAGKYLEALSIYHYIKEIVSLIFCKQAQARVLLDSVSNNDVLQFFFAKGV